jgi:chromosome segregation ATPase
LAEAQARLEDAKRKGVTGIDLQKLDLDARQAALRLDETRERYQDLQQETQESTSKGIDGSDQVVAAQKRVTDATAEVAKAEQGVQDARDQSAKAALESAERVADATRDLDKARVEGRKDIEDAERSLSETVERSAQQQSDAALRVAEAQHQLEQAQKAAAAGAGGSAGGIDKVAEAMKKLSPNAQELVRTLHDLGKDWEALQKVVQQELFAGVSTELRELAGRYFPILQTAMVSVAGSFNKTFKDISGLLQTKETTDQITKGMGNLSKAVGIAGQALVPLTAIFIDLFEVGSEFLPGLASLMRRPLRPRSSRTRRTTVI